MGYLTRSNDLNLLKAVISVWFRIPAATAAAAAADYSANHAIETPILGLGLVPLLMLGAPTTGTVPGLYSPVLIAADQPGGPIIGLDVDGTTASVPLSPSFIGVSYEGDTSGTLAVRIQTADNATASGILTLVTAYDLGSNTYTFADGSYTQVTLPEFFGNSSATNSLSGAGRPSVSNDRWHHLLLSWDLSGGSAVSGDGLTIDAATSAYSLMYCALDDVNRNADNDLPGFYVDQGNGFNPNAMLSNTAFANATASDTGSGLPTVNLTVSDVPASPISIPSPISYSGAGKLIQTAELQIFTGVTLDTSVEVNRRAFVTADGRPEKDYTIADSLLGKSPEVRLEGGSNFKRGRNTGTSGNFPKTGTINSYASPSLA